ncbi:MAG: cyclic nucleotide-binding domain-containing protein [Solirubrobacterales bacterium]|nr:cyclic nucleotide-binding domain-containing protein [Solirubrobacterales bacterium]
MAGYRRVLEIREAWALSGSSAVSPVADWLNKTAPLAVRAFRTSFASPNLRRAQLSFGAAWAGEWAVTVAIGILAFKNGGAAAVGLVGLARMFPAALLAPIAAVVVDRYRREYVLIAVGLVRGVSLSAAALLLWLSASPLPVYALAAVAMLAHTLYRPAHTALLPSICTTAIELTSANVVRGFLDSSSALLGPLLAGALVGPIRIGGVLAVVAATAFSSSWLISRVDYEAPLRPVDAVPTRAAAEAIEGVAIICRERDVRLLTILGSVQTFTRGCFGVFAVVAALQLMALGESGVGVLTAGFGAGAVIGSFAASTLVRSSDLGRWLAIGVAGWGIPFIALAAAPNEIVAVALLAVVGIANAIVDVSYFTLLQWLVSDELMGRVFATDEAVLTLGVAVGAVATPGLIALFGIRGALLTVGLLAPVGALLALSRLRVLDARVHVAGETVAFLQRVPMLSPLSLATITQLAAKASREKASPGTVVIEQGTTGDDFYVITRGQAEVLVRGTRVRSLTRTDCFGEIAALTGRRRISTVSAGSELELLRFDAQHFVRAVTGHAASQTAASALIEERLTHTASVTTADAKHPQPLTQLRALSCLAACGGRLHSPDDAQAEPREA